jgi:hypothetical protein
MEATTYWTVSALSVSTSAHSDIGWSRQSKGCEKRLNFPGRSIADLPDKTMDLRYVRNIYALIKSAAPDIPEHIKIK